jgi:aspartate/methionine/tyrosine aminotransferase
MKKYPEDPIKYSNTAQRLNAIKPFYVMDLLAQAKALESQGEDIIHLEVGEPDFVTPLAVREAGAEAIMSGQTFYTAAKGYQPLREKLSQWYQTMYGVEVSSERFIITPGASSALFLAMSLILDTNDSLMMPTPGYPCNRHFIELLGAKSIEVELNSNFDHNEHLFKQAWQANTQGLLVASPHNPTGTVISKQALTDLSILCESKNKTLIVDEIYHGLVYSNDESTKRVNATSILEVTQQAIVINSFSKYFNMTGWRLGWVIVPEGLQKEADKLAQNLYLAATTSSQIAAVRALDKDMDIIYQTQRLAFQTRRDYLKSALSELGFKVLGEPNGAFYLYVDASLFIKDKWKTSLEFCQDVLLKTGVAITSGMDFDPEKGQQCVRFAYTCELNRLKEAVERLNHYLK